jgi:hypothetical protein
MPGRENEATLAANCIHAAKKYSRLPFSITRVQPTDLEIRSAEFSTFAISSLPVKYQHYSLDCSSSEHTQAIELLYSDELGFVDVLHTKTS